MLKCKFWGILFFCFIFLQSFASATPVPVVAVGLPHQKQALYDPTNGQMTLADHEVSQTLTGFYAPHDLTSSEVSVITALHEPNILLIRHGLWFSIYDLNQMKVLHANLGPFIQRNPSWFYYNSGQSFALFPAGDVIENPNVDESGHHSDPLISWVGVNAKGSLFYAGPLENLENEDRQRLDTIPSRLGVTILKNPSSYVPANASEPLPLHIKIKYKRKDISNNNSNITLQLSPSQNASDLQLRLMELTNLEANPFALFGKKATPQNTERTAAERADDSCRIDNEGDCDVPKLKLAYTFSDHEMQWYTQLDYLQFSSTKIPGLIPYLLKTLTRDSEPQKGVILNSIKNVLSRQSILETRVVAGLKNSLIGQPQAIESFVQASRYHLSSETFPVLMLSGPTGTGKTTGFKAFVHSITPEMKDPVFVFSMSQQHQIEFFQTDLFGSAPGYAGSDQPTAFMLWLLHHPDRGGILFDEVDKSSPQILRVLQTFLENGELVIRPDVFKTIKEMYRTKDVSEWPVALRRATNDGEDNSVATMTIKLGRHHFIGLTGNVGADRFNGQGQSSAASRVLRSDQDLQEANESFTEAQVKSGLLKFGFRDDFINRMTHIIPYKAILRRDHKTIVQQKLQVFLSQLERQFLIRARIDEPSLDVLCDETYEPLQGVRNVQRRLQLWIDHNVRTLLHNGSIEPGIDISLSISPGNRIDKFPELTVLRGQTAIHKFAIGRELPVSAKLLLERAKKNLLQTLRSEVVGHERDLREIYQSIYAQLARQTANPEGKSQPVLLYLDGTSGVGKTATAQAIGKALFDDSESLISIRMNTIQTIHDFSGQFLAPLIDSSRRNPRYLLALLDEFPRTGIQGHREAIHNLLMDVFDSGTLPANPDEVRIVGREIHQETEATKLPGASVFILTGNLVLDLLQASPHETRASLLEKIEKIKQDPSEFHQLYEDVIGAPLRGRIGDPMVFLPLSDEQVALIFDRTLVTQTKLLTDRGLEIHVSDELKTALLQAIPPSLGARPLAKLIRKYIVDPLIVELWQDEFKGAHAHIGYDVLQKTVIARINLQEESTRNLTLAHFNSVDTKRSLGSAIGFKSACEQELMK